MEAQIDVDAFLSYLFGKHCCLPVNDEHDYMVQWIVLNKPEDFYLEKRDGYTCIWKKKAWEIEKIKMNAFKYKLPEIVDPLDIRIGKLKGQIAALAIAGNFAEIPPLQQQLKEIQNEIKH